LNENESFRSKLIQIITENPGLHFRELQRRTGAAVGKLDYHLYQMERKGEIYSIKDNRLVRFFSSTEDTMMERRIAMHMRNQISKEVLIRTAIAGESEIPKPSSDTIKALDKMVHDGILSYEIKADSARVSLNNKEVIINFLKKYSRSFIDSVAYSIFRMLDEL